MLKQTLTLGFGLSRRDITVSRTANELTIVRFPAKPYLAGFLILWLIGWAFGEYDVGHRLLLGLPAKSTKAPTPPPSWRGSPAGSDATRSAPARAPVTNLRHSPLAWIWFLFWTLGGAAAATTLYLMIFAGPETVTVNRDEILAEYNVGHWKRAQRWRASEITAMRIQVVGTRQRTHRIVFDYEGKTSILLPPADLPSTKRILDEIRNYTGGRRQERMFANQPSDR